MKYLMFVLSALLASTCSADCDKYLTAAQKYEEADAVFLCEVESVQSQESSSSIKVNVLRPFKGILESSLEVSVENMDFLHDVEIIERNYFLVYTNKIGSNEHQLTSCFTFQEWGLAEKEMSELEKMVLCIDEEKIQEEAICTMEYDPVCGCDGETYGNDCQAENAGVTSWVAGECVQY